MNPGQSAAIFDVAVMIGMLLLRVGVPLIVLLGIGGWLRRLDRQWQAQADEQRRALLDVSPLTVPHPVAGIPCWEQMNCAEGKRDRCVAYAHPTVPCWLSRGASEGGLPAACLACGIYRNRAGVTPIPQAPVSGNAVTVA